MRYTGEKLRNVSVFTPLEINRRSLTGFTLVELLIVIALLAILSGVAVLVMNPAELIKEGRDATRAADLASLTTSLSLLIADQSTAFMGTSSIIYVSIPDSDLNCSNLGLPPLSPPWTYTCAPQATYRRANGTGWIPVDFTKFSAGSPLSKLPVDPVNTTSTGEHYTYTAGSFKLTALFESVKKAKAMGKDGGLDPARYETGDKPDLPIPINGLVGYWKMDEGGGTSLQDSSGTNQTLTLLPGSPVMLTYQSGKLNGGLTYDPTASTACINGNFGIYKNAATMSDALKNIAAQNFTVSWWDNYYTGAIASFHFSGTSCGAFDGFWVGHNSVSACNGVNTSFTFPAPTNGAWHFYTYVFNKSSGKHAMYIDGVLKSEAANLSGSYGSMSGSYALNIGVFSPGCVDTAKGTTFDEFRIYSRALSDQEIRTIYEATK